MKPLFLFVTILLFSPVAFTQLDLKLWEEGGLFLPEWDDDEIDPSGATNLFYVYLPGIEASIIEDKNNWGGEREPLAGPYMEQSLSQFLLDNRIDDSNRHKLVDKNLLKIFATYPNGRYKNSLYGFVFNQETNTCYRITAQCKKCIDANLKNYVAAINLPSNLAHWGVESWLNVRDINEERKVIFSLDTIVRDSFGSYQDWDFYVKHITNEYEILSAYELENQMINLAGLPLGRNIEINFLDEETGFLYGHQRGYGFYPFMYKTTDGGASWRGIPQSNQFGPIDDAGLYMFDQQRGILIPQWRDLSKLKYFLTEDGGETWQKKEVRTLSKRRAYSSYKVNVIMSFNEEGEVCLSFIRAKRQDWDYNLVLYSSNFGKSFKTIKVWQELDYDLE